MRHAVTRLKVTRTGAVLEGSSVRTQLVVLLVLWVDLQLLILLEPAAWAAMTVIIMAAMAVLIVRISRRLIRPMRNVHLRPPSTKGTQRPESRRLLSNTG
jgi:hypothetical protein